LCIKDILILSIGHEPGQALFLGSRGERVRSRQQSDLDPFRNLPLTHSSKRLDPPSPVRPKATGEEEISRPTSSGKPSELLEVRLPLLQERFLALAALFGHVEEEGGVAG
jgi:hypothetical protein